MAILNLDDQRQPGERRDEERGSAGRRLQAEVSASAEREAADIVAAARVEIGRILVHARRELLGLATQIDTITGTTDETDAFEQAAQSSASQRTALLTAAEGLETKKHLLDARRSLRALIAEVRPQLKRPRKSSSPPAPVGSERVGKGATPWMVISILVALLLTFGAVRWWTGKRGVQQTAPTAAVAASIPPANPSVPPPVAASSPRTAPPSQVDAAPLSLNVELRRPSWMGLTVDGRTEAARVFRPGETKKIAAQHDVVLRVGDGGAVWVSVNDATPAALGKDGEVLTKRFAPSEPANSAGAKPSSARGTAAPPPPRAADRAIGAQRASAARPPPPAPVPVAGSRSSPNSPSSGIDKRAAAQPTTPQTGSEAIADITGGAQRWLDASYRRDTSSMGTLATRDMTVSDERTSDERPPAGTGSLRRGLERTTVQFFGDSAIYTAKMTEQAAAAGSRQYASWLSLIWIRDSGRWRVQNVRILSDAKVKP